jgi:hypothetical protein
MKVDYVKNVIWFVCVIDISFASSILELSILLRNIQSVRERERLLVDTSKTNTERERVLSNEKKIHLSLNEWWDLSRCDSLSKIVHKRHLSYSYR